MMKSSEDGGEGKPEVFSWLQRDVARTTVDF
jgi:hypothetical protein